MKSVIKGTAQKYGLAVYDNSTVWYNIMYTVL